MKRWSNQTNDKKCILHVISQPKLTYVLFVWLFIFPPFCGRVFHSRPSLLILCYLKLLVTVSTSLRTWNRKLEWPGRFYLIFRVYSLGKPSAISIIVQVNIWKGIWLMVSKKVWASGDLSGSDTDFLSYLVFVVCLLTSL